MIDPGADERFAAALSEMGTTMAEVLHPPAGGYRNAVRDGLTLYVAGHGPLRAGRPAHRGRVPTTVGVEEAQAAARLTAANCLATIADELGSLDRVDAVVKVLGMVNADPDFDRHPLVIDGASHLLTEVLGGRGVHARSAVGMASLPFGIPVEVELILRVVHDG